MWKHETVLDLIVKSELDLMVKSCLKRDPSRNTTVTGVLRL